MVEELIPALSFPEIGVGRWELNRLRFVVFFDARLGRTAVVVLDYVNGPHRTWKPAALPRTRGDGHGRNFGTTGSGVGSVTIFVAVCADCACFEARLATLEGGAADGRAFWKEEGLCLVERGRVGFAHLRV